jgi:hypothetical protein
MVMHIDEQREFLDGLHVGDLVVVSRNWREWRVRPVEKLSATRVWVDGTQFDRKTGHKWGSATSFYRDDLLPLTPERIESARMEVAEKKEQAARKALLAAITTALDGAPVALLERVRAMLADP